MSLEQALADNTAAIVKLTEVWLQIASTAAPAAPKAVNSPKAAAGAASPATATKAAAPEKKTPASGTSPTASSAAAAGASEGNAAAEPSTQEAPAASTASSSEPIEYPVLQKAVFTLAGKSRDAAAAVAAGFGVKTFKELPADQWADALAAVNAKLAELEAA